MRKKVAPLLLNVAEAAELVGIAPRRLYALVAQEALPPGVVIRLGRSIRFSRPRLIAWLGIEGAAATEVSAADEQGR